MAPALHQLTDRFQVLFAAWHRADRELFLVGGCVRDVLMNAPTIGDIDLATNATPDETTDILRDAGLPAFPIGARFGTITTIVHGTPVEITTFRSEVYESGNRKPQVEFGQSLVEDLRRRDLSMNAMAAGPGGQLIDPWNGRNAIANRLLEVPGGGGVPNTVSILRDDPLRLLRIARFAARFDFHPTADTTAAARITAPELTNISHERWKMELDKLLAAPHAARALRWLHDVRALHVVLPDLLSLHDVPGGIDTLCERLERTSPHPVTRWSLLLLTGSWLRELGHVPDLAAPRDSWVPARVRDADATWLARELRFSNNERQDTRRLCALPRSWQDLLEPRTRTWLRRWLADCGDLAIPTLELTAALSAPGADHAGVVADARSALHAAAATEDVSARLEQGFGQRLINRFDLERGPVLSRAVNVARQAIIDGELPEAPDTDAVLDWLERHLDRWRPDPDRA